MKYYTLAYRISPFSTTHTAVKDYCKKMNIEISYRQIFANGMSSVIRLINIAEEDMCAMKLIIEGLEFREVSDNAFCHEIFFTKLQDCPF